MTKVVGDLEKAFRNRLKLALRRMGKKKTLNIISRRTAEYIRANAANFGDGKPYKGLSRATIKHRKYLAKNNATHKSFSLRKPNLTITGQLLDSISTTATLAKDTLTFKMNVKGVHRKYKGAKGRGVGKRVANKKIRQGLADMGRDPLQDGSIVNSELIKLFRKAIRMALK